MEVTSDPFYTDIENFLVVIDSRNATRMLNGTFTSRMQFDFEDPIILPRDALKLTCSVLNFTGPNSIYNINETNSYFHLQYTTNDIGTNTIIDIMIYMQYGNYNATTFTSALMSEMLITNPGFGRDFHIDLNTITNRFTFGHDSISFNYMYDSTIYNIIGFEKQITYMTGQSLPNDPYLYTMYVPFTCNFNGIQNLNIVLESFFTSNIDSFRKCFSSIIGSVPIDPNQAQISFIKTNNYGFTIKDDVIDSLRISLKDDFEQYVNLNGQHWNLTLCFSMVRDISRFAHLNSFRNILRNGYN